MTTLTSVATAVHPRNRSVHLTKLLRKRCVFRPLDLLVCFGTVANIAGAGEIASHCMCPKRTWTGGQNLTVMLVGGDQAKVVDLRFIELAFNRVD